MSTNGLPSVRLPSHCPASTQPGAPALCGWNGDGYPRHVHQAANGVWCYPGWSWNRERVSCGACLRLMPGTQMEMGI